MPQNPVETVLFVSQIIAGAGVTVTPTHGTGAVTISTSGSSETFATIHVTGTSLFDGGISGAGVTALFASPPAIGGTAPAAASHTTLNTSGLASLASAQIDTGTKTATATTGAATLNKNAGVITSEALTTAAGADYTLTLTNSDIAAADQVFASVQMGSATTGTPAIATVTPGAGSVVIVVQNIATVAALNGTIKIAFVRFAN